jgi:MFS family permease
VMAIYSGGIHLGSGLGLIIGGLVVDSWTRTFPVGTEPFGLTGWQATFFIVGLPGLLLAFVISKIREPLRGQQEGLVTESSDVKPLAVLGSELASLLPPFALISLWRAGAGPRGIALNIGIGVVLTLGAAAVIRGLGSATQWITLAFGLYAFASWVQGLALRDRPAFTLIYGTKSVVFGMAGFGMMSFVNYGLAFWIAPYFIRVHGVSASEAGVVLGTMAATLGWIGVTLGGIISDRLKRKSGRARLYMGILSAGLSAPLVFLFLSSEVTLVAYLFVAAAAATRPLWIGSAVALANEMVLPRMRATASAFYILSMTFLGLALGPYAMGTMSDALARGGMDSSAALRGGLKLGLIGYGVAIVLLWFASRSVLVEEETRLARAEAAGEIMT